jgi:hypothetical protein
MADMTSQIRCPVFVGYAKTRRHFVLCGQMVSSSELLHHMRDGHEIESQDTLRFYETYAKELWEDR